MRYQNIILNIANFQPLHPKFIYADDIVLTGRKHVDKTTANQTKITTYCRNLLAQLDNMEYVTTCSRFKK